MDTYAEMVEEREMLEKESEEIVKDSDDKGQNMQQEQTDRLNEISTRLGVLDATIKARDDAVEAVAAVHRRRDRVAKEGQIIESSALPVVKDMHNRVEDDPNRGFFNAGEFFSAAYTAFMNPTQPKDERISILSAVTGTSQGEGSSLGMLVPPSFSTSIWDEANVGAENLLSQTDQYNVEGDSLTMLANAETSRATGSRYGGVRGYWIAEAAQMTSSKPKVRGLKLEPKELAVLVYATDKLLRNTTAAGQYIIRAASDEIQFMTGDSIINGDGQGKPLGLMASASTLEIAAEAGQAAATIVAENVIKMWTRLHARARAGAVWYINQEIESELTTMKIDIGTSGQLIYMPAGGISGAPYASIYGRPVVPIEYCQALGTAGDIILTNMQWYAAGVKSAGMRSDSSIHLRFDYNETAFRFLFEVDGQPWLASALTPFKGTNTLSSAVTIATRS
jgi:HK97 family phage major capsid protein